jgi:hypothetical protein
MSFHPELTANNIECTRIQSLQAGITDEALSKEYEHILGSFGKLIQSYNENHCSQYTKLSEKAQKLVSYCYNVSEWTREIAGEACDLQIPNGSISSVVQSMYLSSLRSFFPKKLEEIQEKRKATAETGLKLRSLAHKASHIFVEIHVLAKNNIERVSNAEEDQCKTYWSCRKIEYFLEKLQNKINEKSMGLCPKILLEQLKATLPQNLQSTSILDQNISTVKICPLSPEDASLPVDPIENHNMSVDLCEIHERLKAMSAQLKAKQLAREAIQTCPLRDATKLPVDPVWNHNMSMLFSHGSSNLIVDEEGRLQISAIETESRQSSGNAAFDLGFTLVSSITGSSLKDPKNVTLLNPSELTVLDCATATIQKAAKYYKESNSDVICLLATHPYMSCIPANITKILETLFLSGFTPDTFQAISKINDIEFQTLDLPENLKKLLSALKKYVNKIPDSENSVRLIGYWRQKFSKKIFIHNNLGNREEWLRFSKHVRKLIHTTTSEKLLRIICELDILLEPWQKPMKWANRAIHSTSIRSFMPNPDCREITVDEFLKGFSNIFSWIGGIQMSKVSPSLYNAYRDLQLISPLYKKIEQDNQD